MKANELRVGSWIEEEFNYFRQWTAKDFVDYLNGEEISDKIQPIPLTVEVLEKCGFEDVYSQVPYYKKGPLCMYFDGDGELSANFGHIVRMDVSVKYLHQLQNLYYTLTGEELQYQP